MKKDMHLVGVNKHFSLSCHIKIYFFVGVTPTANKARIKEAFKRVMAANHPDRGGSPYIASKINEAKDFMEKHS